MMTSLKKSFAGLVLAVGSSVFGVIVEVDVLSNNHATVHLLAADGEDFSLDEQSMIREAQMEILRAQQENHENDLAWFALNWRYAYSMQKAQSVSGGMGFMLFNEWCQRGAYVKNIECRHWLLLLKDTDFFQSVPPFEGVRPSLLEQGDAYNFYDVTWDRLFDEYEYLYNNIVERASRLGITFIDEELQELRGLYKKLQRMKGTFPGDKSILAFAIKEFINALKEQANEQSIFVVNALERSINEFIPAYSSLSDQEWERFVFWQQSRFKLLKEGYNIDYENLGYAQDYSDFIDIVSKMGDVLFALNVFLTIFETTSSPNIVVMLETYQVDLLNELLCACGFRPVFSRPEQDSHTRFVGTNDLESSFNFMILKNLIKDDNDFADLPRCLDQNLVVGHVA